MIITFVTILIQKASMMLSRAINYNEVHLSSIFHEIRVFFEGISIILTYELFKEFYIKIQKNKKSNDQKNEGLLAKDYYESFIEQLESLQEKCENEGKTEQQTFLILVTEVIKFHENAIIEKIKSIFDSREAS